MGLLDFEDPNTAGMMQLGMGLLNAGGPSRMPVSVGQGIAQAGGGAMDAMRQARKDLLLKKVADLEIQKGQMTLDQMKTELAADKAFMEVMKNPMAQQGQSQPYGGGYSPSVAGEFGVPQGAPQQQQRPQRNSDLLLQAAKQTGSRKMYENALKMAIEEKKLDPKYGNAPVTMMKGGVPTSVRFADDGTQQEVAGYSPANEVHFGNTGKAIQGFDKYTGKPFGPATAVGMTADQEATLPIQRMNAGTAARNATTNENEYKFKSSPDKQAEMTGEKKTAELKAEGTVKAQQNLPQATANVSTAINLIDRMIGDRDENGKLKMKKGGNKAHKGFESYVGFTATPGMRFVEGSDTASYQSMHNQLLGATFLDAYETLKGGGQITEIEGKKATAAKNRMEKAQSESEYIAAAVEYKAALQRGLKLLEQKAKSTSSGSGWKDL